MAKTKIGGVTVEIGADTSDLSRKLKEVNTESKKTTSELKSIDAALKQAPNSLELWKQKQEALTKVVENSKKKLEALVSEQENLKKGLENGTVTEDAYKAFQREIEITKGQIESAEKALKDFTDTEKGAGQAAKTTGDEVADSGKKAESSSGGYTMLKNVVANLAADGFERLITGLKDAKEQALEFEESIAKVSTIADDSVSIEKLRDDIISLSNDSGIAANVIANATYDAISAGQSTADAVEFVGKATKLARAGFADAGDTLDLLTTILNAYHLEASDTTKVMDILIQTQNLGKTSVGQMSSAMGKVIPTANAYDVSLEQLAAGYAIMTANGVATAETTTYMNSMLNELGKSGAKASNVLKDETGKSFKELMDDGNTLADVLAIIKDNADKNNLSFGDLWGSAEAGKAGLVLLGESAEAYNETLEKMQNSAGATDTAFEKLETKEYKLEKAQNRLKNTMIAIGSSALESIVPLAEKALPIIEKKLDNFDKNLPKIEKNIKNIIPLAESAATAYASWKVASTAVDGAKALSALAKEMKTTGAAAESLNSIIATGTTAGVALLVVGLIDLGREIKKAHDNYVPMAERISKDVSDSFKEQREAIDAVSDSIDGVNQSFKDATTNADYEADHTRALWEELQKLADESGRVKDADKLRAEYITEELSGALDTEISMTGTQIDNYKQLQTEIDKLIEKKRAAAYIDAYQANVGEMAQNKATTYEQYLKAYSQEKAALDELNKLASERYGRTFTPEEFQKKMSSTYGKNDVWNTIDSRMYKLATTAQTEAASRKELQEQYQEISDYFDRLESAEMAFSQQQYDEVAKRLYYQKDANAEILSDTKATADEVNKVYQDELSKIEGAFTLARESHSKLAKSDVKSLMKSFTEAATASMKTGGKKSGEIFDDNFRNIVQQMVDEGYDISDLAQWGKESGIQIGDVFGNNYDKVIQAQIDEGFDVTALLQWATVSGEMVASMWVRYFTSNAQRELDSFYETNAQRSSEVSGPLTLSESNAKKNAGNSYGPQPLKKHAIGGTEYSRGIVAEEGPELLEIINGGVRITPLTPTAVNTPISGKSGDTIIKTYNNYISADVSSDYDVDKLAERLASAEKSIEEGKGR